MLERGEGFPMKTDVVSNTASAGVSDRRRHARYRFSTPITVHPSNRPAMPGMSLEISESGMSVLIGDALKVGEAVRLQPIAGGDVSALVRRQTGKIYGLEFLNLTSAQMQRIAENCKRLPLYRDNTLGI